ncbi:MAG: lanthionine synthetase C family protein [bacterium]|nr:lanthionine synthetase C family protein [bacterium]
MTWQAIISPGNGAFNKIAGTITQITTALQDHIQTVENIGLLTGLPGVAVYLSYYNSYLHIAAPVGKETGKYLEKAQAVLDRVFEIINSGEVKHTFCSGLAGTGWAVAHLMRHDFIQGDADELLDPLDDFLYQTMLKDMSLNYYDYLHGALGYGLYFLERRNSKKTRNYLIRLVDELDRLSLKDADGGLKWQVPMNLETGAMGCNLGMSHGMASIIAVLAKLLEAGIHTKKVSHLLSGAMKYILGRVRDASVTKNISCFPSWVSEEKPSLESRLAWCYGDLGIGMALWQASRIAENKEWEEKALAVLLHTTGRQDYEAEGVGDPGFCHGAAGLAHCYNRMYHYTGIETFKKSALYWFRRVLEMATFEDGLAGYKAWHSQTGWQKEAGILEGIAGIGLALISATTEIKPLWDRALLLS